MDLVAALRATTRSVVFFCGLQYIPGCVEVLLEEQKEKDFHEESNRKGDDEGEENKNRDINGVRRSGIL